VEDVLAAAARYRGAARRDPAGRRERDPPGELFRGDRGRRPWGSRHGSAADVPERVPHAALVRDAASRPPEPVDARIEKDVVWVLRRYQLARDRRPGSRPSHARRRYCSPVHPVGSIELDLSLRQPGGDAHA